jgi:hypothetical protein
LTTRRLLGGSHRRYATLGMTWVSRASRLFDGAAVWLVALAFLVLPSAFHHRLTDAPWRRPRDAEVGCHVAAKRRPATVDDLNLLWGRVCRASRLFLTHPLHSMTATRSIEKKAEPIPGLTDAGGGCVSKEKEGGRRLPHSRASMISHRTDKATVHGASRDSGTLGGLPGSLAAAPAMVERISHQEVRRASRLSVVGLPDVVVVRRRGLPLPDHVL